MIHYLLQGNSVEKNKRVEGLPEGGGTNQSVAKFSKTPSFLGGNPDERGSRLFSRFLPTQE